MKLTINHYGRVRGGKVIFELPALYQQELIGLEGKDIVMTIKKRHQKATMSQYGYYRAAILGACYESEMFSSMDNRDQIHELYFAPKFLSFKTMTEISGKKVEVNRVRSLADLDKDEMSDFVSRVLADCADNEIEVLAPELYMQKYYQK